MHFPKGTIIGNYNSLAAGVKFLSGNHPIDHASTAACFYNPIFNLVDSKNDIKRSNLTICNDVWIGANVLITSKVTTIPNGCVIGAGSILTKNPEPYGIYVGNPARLLRKRFDDKTIKLLEESKWWELQPKIITQFIDIIDKPEEFANEVLQYRKINNI